MQKDVTITARIEGELSERLAKLAALQGRSKSWLVGEALKSYLATELSFIEAVEEGRRDLEQGRTVSHEEVAERFRSRFRIG